MSTTEAIMKKVSGLPLDKQERVLEFVESISGEGRAQKKDGKPYEWMEIAMSMNLDGPSDMSEHLDDYLYGDKRNAW